MEFWEKSGLVSKIPRLIHADISEKMIIEAINHATSVGCDEEFLPIVTNFGDAKISCLSLLWTNDFSRALGKITAILKADLLFSFSKLGGQILLNSEKC